MYNLNYTIDNLFPEVKASETPAQYTIEHSANIIF